VMLMAGAAYNLKKMLKYIHKKEKTGVQTQQNSWPYLLMFLQREISLNMPMKN
jgi:hypothetical protein